MSWKTALLLILALLLLDRCAEVRVAPWWPGATVMARWRF